MEEKPGIVLRLNDSTVPIIAPAPRPEAWFGQRHVFALMGFLGFANAYAMRVNMSVAIVAMVNSSAIPERVNVSSACPVVNDTESDADSQEDGEFAWDENTQGIILGSFFWGYVLTQIPGGRLAERYGGKRLYGYGLFVTALFTLLTPFAARLGIPYLIVVRAIEGLGEGVTTPSMHAMLAHWSPPLERSRLSAFVYTGVQFGTVISLPSSGLLAQSQYGWPAIFYVFGSVSLVWFIVWMYLIYDRPSLHPHISDKERIYIETSLISAGHTGEISSVPYKAIFSSVPFWALFVTHFCQNWGFYTLLTELPTYMKNILQFNIMDNSFLSALPYLTMCISGNIFSLVADMLRTRRILTTTVTRKLMNTIGFVWPAAALIWASYTGCNTVFTIILITAAVGINGAVFSGYNVNHLDLAPRYAGTLMGFTNCFANIPGIIAPYVTGALISGQETLGQWRKVFFLSAGIYLLGDVIFVIFGSGEEQPWNKTPQKDKDADPPLR